MSLLQRLRVCNCVNMANWTGYSNWVRFVEFKPDGKGLQLMGARSWDGTVKYWGVGSLGIHEAAPGSGRTCIPIDSVFFWTHCAFLYYRNTVCRDIYLPLHIGRHLPYCVLAQKQCITSDDTSVLIWDIGTGVWQLVVH